MVKVKSFRVHPQHGVPDKDIREWMTMLEKDGTIDIVTTTYIPGIPGDGGQGTVDPRLNVIVTVIGDGPVNG
jgi:hypothetical protein